MASADLVTIGIGYIPPKSTVSTRAHHPLHPTRLLVRCLACTQGKSEAKI